MAERREEEEEEEVKWAGHYCSTDEILLVGEGDFSFSLSLANAFGSAINIVATSFDSFDALTSKYRKAKSNLRNLALMGATLLHKIDATKMKMHPDINMRKFDRVVFNFPHAGFKGREDHLHLIGMHRKLVSGFFKNASRMLRPYGEVHITHKTNVPFCHWNLEELAWKNSLMLTGKADFEIEDYPGYKNKRGDGDRCDQPFHLGKCSTFKFRIAEFPSKEPAIPIPMKKQIPGLLENSYRPNASFAPGSIDFSVCPATMISYPPGFVTSANAGYNYPYANHVSETGHGLLLEEELARRAFERQIQQTHQLGHFRVDPLWASWEVREPVGFGVPFLIH